MELVPGNPLLTAIPQAGRELAITMARKTHVVAIEFATVAAADNYWRDASG